MSNWEDDGMKDQGPGYGPVPLGTWTDTGMQMEPQRKQRTGGLVRLAGQAAKALFDSMMQSTPAPRPPNLRQFEYNTARAIVESGGTLKADVPAEGMKVITSVSELHYAFSRDARFYSMWGRPLVGADSIQPAPEPDSWIPEAGGLQFTPTPGLAPAGVAAEFLLQTLEQGPVPARVVIDRAKQAGIAKRTLDRAKDALGITSFKDAVKGWFWRLGGK
jgi:hypothetical protein